MAKSRQGKPLNSLSDLTQLKTELEQSRQTVEAEQARAARAQAEAKRAQQKQQCDRLLFEQYCKSVNPLPKADRVLLGKPKPEPIPKFSKGRGKQTVPSDLSDDWSGSHLINPEHPMSWSNNGVRPAHFKKLKAGGWVIQAQVDLHGHRVEEARVAVSEFIQACARSGLQCVRVVHGKGLSSPKNTPVLKEKVRDWLLQLKPVLAFCPAPEKEGGDGALLVLLKTNAQDRKKSGNHA